MSTPVIIKEVESLITAIDPADAPSNFAYDLRGLRCMLDAGIAQRDFGTLHRYTIPPIRPNVFKVVEATSSSGGLVNIQITGHGYSTGDKVWVDELINTVEGNGAWLITWIDNNNFTLQGSTFVHAYGSPGGGIVTKTPIVIIHGWNFVDGSNSSEYDIVVGLDSGNLTRIYVYDSASTEASKWIELTKRVTTSINGTPAATAKTLTMNATYEEYGPAITLATNAVQYWIAYNVTKGTTAFIVSSTSTVLACDNVLGANGLGWVTGDTIYIYRFPAIAFNYTFANGGSYSDPSAAKPWISWLAVEAQRKVTMLYQHTDGTKRQAIQIMRRNARNYFYDTSSTTYLRTLPAGWYVESDFGILNPFAATYGAIASPKSPGGGNFTTLAASGASNATPIVVTVPSTAGLATGDIVVGSGFVTNTTANSMFSITVVNATTFQLNGSVGNGATGTGVITVYKNLGAIYDKTSGRNWLNLFGTLMNGSTAKATGQIIFNTPVNGDKFIFNYAQGAANTYTKAAAYAAYPTNEYSTADELVTLLTANYSTVFTFVNVAGTITITAINSGTIYNGSRTFVLSGTGTLAVSNVSQGATSTPNVERYFEGGIDTTAVYSQARVYVTAKYTNYQQSDPVLQAFLQGDTAAQPPDLLLTPILSFALMNKEITHLNLYAAFQNTTVVASGWLEAPSDYILLFSLPIQSATTDVGYFATEWYDGSTVIKSMQPIYSYDISQIKKMEASSSNFDAANSAAAVNILTSLNHAVDMNRTYPTPRFAAKVTRAQGSVTVIDVDDLTARICNRNGDQVTEDDNFSDVVALIDGTVMQIFLSGSGEMLGMAIQDEQVHFFRKTEREYADLQGDVQGITKCDFTAKKSLFAGSKGLSWCGEYGIYLLRFGGEEIRLSNPIQNKYDGTLYVTGTTPYISSTQRAGIVGGYSRIYDLNIYVVQMSKSSGYEYAALVFSFLEKPISKKMVGWYERKFNIGTDGAASSGVMYFTEKRSDGTCTIGYSQGVLQYPNRAGSFLYQDEVAIDGSANQHSLSKGIPTRIRIIFGELYSITKKFVVDTVRIDFSGSSISGTGAFNMKFYANKLFTLFETKTFPIDQYPRKRGVPPIGALERFAVQLDLTEGAESDFKAFDISTITIDVSNPPGYGNK